MLIRPLPHTVSTSSLKGDGWRVLALTLGSYAVVGGAVSFLGWPLDVPHLTDWFGDGVSIQPNAALLIALAGIGVILVQLAAWRAAAALGALIAAAGALTLVQYLVGADFGFNDILLFDARGARELR